MTVKGLEPEIQRLIAKHKGEVKKLKSIHEAELLASDERAGQRYVAMTEELRDQLSKEKESACARERELARQMWAIIFCNFTFQQGLYGLSMIELDQLFSLTNILKSLVKQGMVK